MIDRIRQLAKGSIRRSCRVLGLRRQTYYRRKQGFRSEQRDDQIIELLHRVTRRFVAWGFWLVFYYLRRQGHPWNHKRVYRVWKQEGLHLRLPPRRPKIRRTYQDLLAPDGINEGWAMDFVSDWVLGHGQQVVRIINIMDEGSRRALWTEAHSSISAKKLVEVLNKVVDYRGCPKYIRCDNGPEFIAHRLQQWAAERNIEIKYIQPGKPSQNGLIERLNKTLRKECLNLAWFTSMDELNEQLQDWSQIYNHERPHLNLGRQTPEEYELDNQKFYFSVVAA
jgi:putative transposase